MAKNKTTTSNEKLSSMVKKSKNDEGWLPNAEEVIEIHLAQMLYLSDTFEKRRKKSKYTKLQQVDHDMKLLGSFLANPDLPPKNIDSILYALEEKEFKYSFLDDEEMTEEQKKFWGITPHNIK